MRGNVEASFPCQFVLKRIQERLWFSFDLAAIAGFYPTRRADKSNRASSKPCDVMRRTISERLFQKIKHQPHFIGVTADYIFRSRLIFRRHRLFRNQSRDDNKPIPAQEKEKLKTAISRGFFNLGFVIIDYQSATTSRYQYFVDNIQLGSLQIMPTNRPSQMPSSDCKQTKKTRKNTPNSENKNYIQIFSAFLNSLFIAG